MEARQLVIDALEGRSTPRLPCGPLAVHFCARNVGVTIPAYSTDAELLADCVLRYYDKFKPDAVWLSSDTWVTAEAMGAHVSAPDEDEPLASTDTEGVIQTMADIERIPPADPTTQGRQPLMLEAMSHIKENIGDDVFIVGCFDQSPFSLACAMGGINEVMMKTLTDEPFVNALLERCVEYATAYGQALAARGANMLSTGDSPAGLVGPDLFRKFCLPAEQRVFETLRRTTDCKLSLHICGDARPYLDSMIESGADVLELDHWVEMKMACEVVPENIAIWGNLDPVDVLLFGDEEHVSSAAESVYQEVRKAGRKRFVLSSGCTLAPDTPDKNVHALIGKAHACAQ